MAKWVTQAPLTVDTNKRAVYNLGLILTQKYHGLANGACAIVWRYYGRHIPFWFDSVPKRFLGRRTKYKHSSSVTMASICLIIRSRMVEWVLPAPLKVPMDEEPYTTRVCFCPKQDLRLADGV
jgi:hypothetical protein